MGMSILDMIKEESKTYYLFSSLGLVTLCLPLFPEHLYAEEIRLYLSFQATLKSSLHSTTTPRHEGGVEGETGRIQRQKATSYQVDGVSTSHRT